MDDAQSAPKPWPKEIPGATAHVYKQTPQGELRLFVFAPKGHKASDKRPAIVFFFGGGWKRGGVGQFSHHSKHLASKGMIGIVAEYRVESMHGTSPFECVADGISAMRWVRAHAADLGIDPTRLGAGGGSAGGHVALATATLQAFGEKDEDASVSPMPDALALFNPVIDTTQTGWKGGPGALGERCRDLSPIHHLAEKMPPTIVFHGTNDTTVPFANAKSLQAGIEKQGVKSVLVPYEGRGHGFFNFGRGGGADYEDTIEHLEKFLGDIGWLPAD